jgi:hypothetical protein
MKKMARSVFHWLLVRERSAGRPSIFAFWDG